MSLDVVALVEAIRSGEADRVAEVLAPADEAARKAALPRIELLADELPGGTRPPPARPPLGDDVADRQGWAGRTRTWAGC